MRWPRRWSSWPARGQASPAARTWSSTARSPAAPSCDPAFGPNDVSLADHLRPQHGRCSWCCPQSVGRRPWSSSPGRGAATPSARTWSSAARAPAASSWDPAFGPNDVSLADHLRPQHGRCSWCCPQSVGWSSWLSVAASRIVAMFDDGLSGADLDTVLSALPQLGTEVDDATRIDQIAALERLKSGCAAAQARVTADLDHSRRTADAAVGIPAKQRGAGLGDEIALARREDRKSTRLNFSHVAISYAVFCLKKTREKEIVNLSLDETTATGNPNPMLGRNIKLIATLSYNSGMELQDEDWKAIETMVNALTLA